MAILGEDNVCRCGNLIESNSEACDECRADAAADRGDDDRKSPPEDCL